MHMHTHKYACIHTNTCVFNICTYVHSYVQQITGTRRSNMLCQAISKYTSNSGPNTYIYFYNFNIEKLTKIYDRYGLSNTYLLCTVDNIKYTISIAYSNTNSDQLTTVVFEPFWIHIEWWTDIEDVRIFAFLQMR